MFPKSVMPGVSEDRFKRGFLPQVKLSNCVLTESSTETQKVKLQVTALNRLPLSLKADLVLVYVYFKTVFFLK